MQNVMKTAQRQFNEDEALLKSSSPAAATPISEQDTSTKRKVDEHSTATATEESPTQVPSADDQDGIATEDSTKRRRLAKGVNDEQASFDKAQ